MSYKIEVRRTGGGTGTIKFQGRSESCWEDPHKLIPTGTYHNCTAGYMAEKRRIAIAINHVPGRTAIYIHEGNSVAWSDGCIACSATFVKQMYDTLWNKGRAHAAVLVVE